MPEGPEVRQFVTDTKKHVLDHKLISFKGYGDKDRRTSNIEALNKKLPSEVEKYFSKGKKVFMFLKNNYAIIFSFGLTGVMVPEEKVNKDDYIRYKPKYFRYGMKFSGDHMIYFSDVISYGSVKIITREEANKELEKLGPDFFDYKISMSEWKEIMDKKTVQKKILADFFSDQQYVSGVGNMYRAEIMYKSKIYPLRKISSMSEADVEKLYTSTKSILKAAYSDDDWKTKVYEQEKDNHGNEVKKLKHKGRTIYYCPAIQN